MEKKHLVEAAHFELGRVSYPHIQQKMVEHFAELDLDLAAQVAAGLGLPAPTGSGKPNRGQSSARLSQTAFMPPDIATMRVALLAADGVSASDVERIRAGLQAHGAVPEVVGVHPGALAAEGGAPVPVDRALGTVASVMYDAVVVPGGKTSVATLVAMGPARHFVAEAFLHAKPSAALAEGVELVAAVDLPGVRVAGNGDGLVIDVGVVTASSNGQGLSAKAAGAVKDAVSPGDDFVNAVVESMTMHRHWERALETVSA